jgi:hypothetical protein
MQYNLSHVCLSLLTTSTNSGVRCLTSSNQNTWYIVSVLIGYIPSMSTKKNVLKNINDRKAQSKIRSPHLAAGAKKMSRCGDLIVIRLKKLMMLNQLENNVMKCRVHSLHFSVKHKHSCLKQYFVKNHVFKNIFRMISILLVIFVG